MLTNVPRNVVLRTDKWCVAQSSNVRHTARVRSSCSFHYLIRRVTYPRCRGIAISPRVTSVARWSQSGDGAKAKKQSGVPKTPCRAHTHPRKRGQVGLRAIEQGGSEKKNENDKSERFGSVYLDKGQGRSPVGHSRARNHAPSALLSIGKHGTRE